MGEECVKFGLGELFGESFMFTRGVVVRGEDLVERLTGVDVLMSSRTCLIL